MHFPSTLTSTSLVAVTTENRASIVNLNDQWLALSVKRRPRNRCYTTVDKCPEMLTPCFNSKLTLTKGESGVHQSKYLSFSLDSKLLSFKVKWLYFLPTLIQKASLIDLGTWHKIRKWLINSVFILWMIYFQCWIIDLKIAIVRNSNSNLNPKTKPCICALWLFLDFETPGCYGLGIVKYSISARSTA